MSRAGGGAERRRSLASASARSNDARSRHAHRARRRLGGSALSENPVPVPTRSTVPGWCAWSTATACATVTLDRADALNAFNEALYDAVTDTLLSSAEDPSVAVVLLTGNGRAFCAGTDLLEMAARALGSRLHAGCARLSRIDRCPDRLPETVDHRRERLGLGIGTTILGFADLAFMSTTARLKCPFTSLGVSPEAASSFTFPALLGRQNATWVLMSSEWIEAEEAHSIGLVWKVTEPDALLPEARRYAVGAGGQTHLQPRPHQGGHCGALSRTTRRGAGSGSPPRSPSSWGARPTPRLWRRSQRNVRPTSPGFRRERDPTGGAGTGATHARDWAAPRTMP